MTNENDGKQVRFRREAAPYFEDFEMTVSTLLETQKRENPFIDATLDLMKVFNNHLAECQELLGKTETLVEEARARKESPDEIEKLVQLCRDQQQMQLNIANEVMRCVNNVIDNLFPR